MVNKSIKLGRGTELEYMVCAVFQGQGYLVRRAVPLRCDPDGRDATDIDMLGIKFTQPFQPHRIICDCRMRQRAKPFERVFWAKGLGNYIHASEVYVSVPKASLGIINFARSGQVRILTNVILKETYAMIYCGGKKPYGLANPSFYEPFFGKLRSTIKKNKNATEIISDVMALYMMDNPYVALNIALSHLKTIADKIGRDNQSVESYDLLRYIAAELIVVISLILLYIASDTIGILREERQRYIKRKLTYGDISPKKAEEIFHLAKELAIEAAISVIPEASRQTLLPFDIGRIEPPPYADNIVGLIERIIKSPYIYHNLPQVIDFLLYEQSLQNRGFIDDEYRLMFPEPNQEERLKAARNIFAFVRDTVNFDLKIFWPKSDNHLPKRKKD